MHFNLQVGKLSKEKFDSEVKKMISDHDQFLAASNERLPSVNGIYHRFEKPIITAAHVPLHWRFDFDYESNPMLQERLGMNVAFNSGAIELDGKILLVVRAEGNDRKSFFAVAESETGTDNFRFWDLPIELPETSEPDTNVYDMRVVKHEDGWIYGTFCTERRDPKAAKSDQSSAVAACGIVRTKDLKSWERLPDLISYSGQQRNVVLHPEFVNGKYALYTRPQDGFIDTGSGGGIGWGFAESMEYPEVKEEVIIENKVYHTIKEVKNGQGPAPIKTEKGWLHLAHGVRNTAAGLRYVLYMFMTALDDPSRVIHQPGGHFMAPEGEERVGDVSNVLFTNGWVARDNGDVLIYYASSDTRMHVAYSTVDALVDYTMNTPEDGFRSAASVQQRIALARHNMEILKGL